MMIETPVFYEVLGLDLGNLGPRQIESVTGLHMGMKDFGDLRSSRLYCKVKQVKS
jgi:hypothetical protein